MTEETDRLGAPDPEGGRLRKRLAVALSALVFAVGAGGALGCDDDDDEGAAEEVEQAGEEIDEEAEEAADEAGEALEDADQEVGEDEK
jgi:hypothetical protein